MPDDNNDVLQYAKDMEWIIMPLKGKIPVLPNWQTLAEPIFPTGNQNYGLVCGENSNVCVIDVDVDDGGSFHWAGILSLFDRDITDTIIVDTPSGGYHYYFQYDSDIKTSAKCIKVNGEKIGIDVRSDKGQVVCAGSIYQTSKPDKQKFVGKKYKYREDPYMCELLEIPPLLKQLLLGNKELLYEHGKYTVIDKPEYKQFVHEHDDIIDDDKFTRAVMGLSSQRYDDRDDWIKVIFAIIKQVKTYPILLFVSQSNLISIMVKTMC
jgi:hypothetical protein